MKTHRGWSARRRLLGHEVKHLSKNGRATDNTTLAYNSLRMSTSHIMILERCVVISLFSYWKTLLEQHFHATEKFGANKMMFPPGQLPYVVTSNLPFCGGSERVLSLGEATNVSRFLLWHQVAMREIPRSVRIFIENSVRSHCSSCLHRRTCIRLAAKPMPKSAHKSASQCLPKQDLDLAT